MRYECKITVLETKCFPDLQEQYLADPKSGPCPFFKPGDAFLLKRTKEWCDDNADNALSMKSFANFLSQYAETYHLIPDNNIYRGKEKRCRGYRGVEVIDHDNPFLK